MFINADTAVQKRVKLKIMNIVVIGRVPVVVVVVMNYKEYEITVL
jgi:hypothetical protein